MIDIPFIIDFAEKGNLSSYIQELKEMRDLMKENQKLAKQFGTANAAAVQKLLTDYNNLNAKLAETQKKVQASADTKQLMAVTAELEKMKKQYADLYGELTRLTDAKKKANAVTDDELKKQLKAQDLMNKRKATIRDALKDQQALEVAMRKEVKSLDDLNKQTAALVRIRSRLDLTTKEGQKQFDIYTKKINENTAAQKKFDQQIGRNFRNVGNYRDAVKGFSNQLLQLAGISGGVMIFKNAITQIGEFEQSFADLQSILGSGITEKQYEELRKGAIEWGKDSTASARDIVEAYKLIGSAKPELLQNIELLKATTKEAILLSDASGLQLPDAATRLTDALNQFNMTGAESHRVVNVLAAGAKAGSAEIPETTDALLKFGIVAKNFNVSFEESVGLIQSFAERGLKGAEAGTALRNVLLKMQATRALPKRAVEELRAAGVNMDILSDSTIPLRDRIEELAKIQGNASAMAKVFGVENVVAGSILIENRKHAEEFTRAVTGTNTAQEQAAKRTDTLQGELKKLANAWQSAIIGFSEGGGSLKDIVRFIRENLETILNVIINVTQAFIAYKVAVMAVNAAYKAKDIVSYIMNLRNVKKGIQQATESQVAMNKAMKANVIGLVIAGIVTLIDQLDLFTSAADRAAAAQARVNDEFNKQKEAMDVIQAGWDETIQGISDRYDEAIRSAKRQGADIIQLEKDKTAAIDQEMVKQRDIIRKDLGERYELLAQQEKDIKALQDVSRDVFEEGEFKKLEFEMAVNVLRIEEEERRLNESLKLGKKNVESLTDLQIQAAEEEEEETDKQKKEREKKAQEEFDRRVRNLEREKMLREINIKQTIDEEDARNLALMDSELKFFNDRKELEELFRKDTVKSRLDILNQEQAILKQRADNYKKYVDAIINIQNQADELEIQLIEDERDREIAAAMKETEDKLANIKVTGEEASKLEALLLEELRKKLRAINDKYDKEDYEKGIEAIDRYYKEVELNTLESGQTREQIEDELQQNEINRLEELIAERKAAGEDVIDLELELARKRQEIKDKEAEEDKQRAEDLQNFIMDSAKALNDALEKEIENRINKAQEEVEKQRENVEAQRQLAIEGKENTLLEEEDLLAKREKKLLEEQRKQERLKLIESYLNALAVFSKDDPNTAPVKAAAMTFAAKALAAKLEKGGILEEEVDSQSSIHKGIFRGKRHAQGGIKIPYLEFQGNEGILNDTEMRNLGRDNFYGLKKALNKPVKGNMFESGAKEMINVVQMRETKATVDLSPLQKDMRDIKKAIEEKPVTHFSIMKDGSLLTETTAPGLIKRVISKGKKSKGRFNG